MSRSRSKVRYAMILVTIICGLANADSISGLSKACVLPNSDSITDFSAKCTLRFRNTRVPPPRYAARFTGVNLPSIQWIDPRVPVVPPVRFFLHTDLGLPSPRGMSEFERDLYLVIDVLQHLILGKERKVMSIYRGCRKSRDADTCHQYNGK